MRVARSPLFVDDLSDAYNWIFEDSPNAASQLLVQVDRAARLLGAFPKAGRLRADLGAQIRSFRIRRFRYVLIYRVTRDTVLLLRLVHGSRDLTDVDFESQD